MKVADLQFYTGNGGQYWTKSNIVRHVEHGVGHIFKAMNGASRSKFAPYLFSPVDAPNKAVFVYFQNELELACFLHNCRF